MLARNMASMSGLSLYRNAIQFALNILMAHFILPAEYGLLVFTAPFIAFLGLMTDFGLSSAIVRSEALSERQTSAAFSLTLVLGFALGLGLAVLSAPIQHVVHMRGLAPIMTAMSAIVFLNVSASVPRALLERRLLYGRIAGVEAGAVLISAAGAILAALFGAGVWALVGYHLSNQTLRALAYGWTARGGLRLGWAWSSLRALMSFGGWVLATNCLTFLSRNSDNLLIGSALGAASLGVYGLAYQFMVAPLMAITWPTAAVLFAMLSRQGPNARLVRETTRGVFSATAMASFPAMAYLTFGLAYPVHVMLSAHWSGVPAVVTWLAPLGALQSICSYSGAVLMASGRARLQFLINLANTVVTVAVFVVSVRWGLLGLVKAYVVASACLSLFMLAVMVRNTALTWSDVAHALAPPALASCAGLVGVTLSMGLARDEAVQWAVSTAVFAVGVLGVYGAMFARLRTGLAVLIRPMVPDGI